MSIDKPEWDRYRVVQPPGSLSHAGDPNRWGASITTQLPAPGLVPQQIVSDQFIRAQCTDRYVRSWSIVGQLTLPGVVWNDVAGSNFFAILEVSQGVGQTTVVQQILLASNGVAPFGQLGLCNSQSFFNGGPFVPIPGFTPAGVATESRPFAAIGALIGNALAIRMVYAIPAGAAGLPAPAVVSAIITPYAPGEGM